MQAPAPVPDSDDSVEEYDSSDCEDDLLADAGSGLGSEDELDEGDDSDSDGEGAANAESYGWKTSRDAKLEPMPQHLVLPVEIQIRVMQLAKGGDKHDLWLRGRLAWLGFGGGESLNFDHYEDEFAVFQRPVEDDREEDRQPFDNAVIQRALRRTVRFDCGMKKYIYDVEVPGTVFDVPNCIVKMPWKAFVGRLCAEEDA
ncbi:hypothetical protein MNV49_006055 [Pseudohyphozyma bogoriensis]|nr:hypothetical protein MNV49_006055 [Pseudohyphozyma bogoriensis]